MHAPEDRRAPRSGLLLLLALTAVFAAYSNALAGEFVWDDQMLIVDQPQVHALRSPWTYLGGVFWEKSASQQANPVYYRPLVTMSYALDWVRSGGGSTAFHVTNVLLHLVACGLVFGLARRFGASAMASALAAAAFGLLPRLTENVAWISGRTDVLAAVFALSALLVHPLDPGRTGRRVIASVLLLAALLSKEVGIAALAAIAILELERARTGRDGWRRAAVGLAPALGATAVYAVLRVVGQRGQTIEPLDLSPGARMLAPVQALGANLLMVLDPLRPRLQIGLLREVDPEYVGAGVAAVALLAVAVRRGVRARWPAPVWALAAFAATAIALVLHVLPIRLNVMACDRFLYFPAAGAAAAFAVGAERLGIRTRRITAFAALVALPVLGTATYRRNPDWHDELHLWRAAVETTPEQNALPRIGLGDVLMRKRLFLAARHQFERALPNAWGRERIFTLGNLASVRSELGDYDGAAEIMRQLLREEPDLPLHHFNLGIAEARQLSFDAAEREFREARGLLPEYPEADDTLGIVQGARRELAALPPASDSDTTAVSARRARVWERLGRYRDAETAWLRVVDAKDAAKDDLKDAIAYLVWKGSFGAAERASQRAGEAGLVAGEDLLALRAEIDRRRADEAAAAMLP